TLDPGEPGLSGWTVYDDLNPDGLLGSYPTTFTSQDTPLAIPVSPAWGTFGVVTSVIDVSGLAGLLTNVSVTLNINETVDADLVITLISPWGDQVNLINQEGFNGQNFTGTVLDDSAPTPISSGSAPFTGTYQPEQPLGTLENFNPNGAWHLVVEDVWPGPDVGTVLNWSLTLSAPEPSPTTDAKGDFSLTGLPQGSNSILMVVPGGWTQTTPNPDPITVTTSGAITSGLSFGAFQSGTATGQVYQDTNG